MKQHSKLRLALAITLASSVSATVHAAGGGVAQADPGAMQGKHFDAKGKLPSPYTIELQKALRKSLPFEDKRDFEEAQKGFIAAPAYKQIMAEAGNVAWDMGSYEYLLQGKDFDSIHPSLQRQAVLIQRRDGPQAFGGLGCGGRIADRRHLDRHGPDRGPDGVVQRRLHPHLRTDLRGDVAVPGPDEA